MCLRYGYAVRLARNRASIALVAEREIRIFARELRTEKHHVGRYEQSLRCVIAKESGGNYVEEKKRGVRSKWTVFGPINALTPIDHTPADVLYRQLCVSRYFLSFYRKQDRNGFIMILI